MKLFSGSFFENVRMKLDTLWQHKLRSFLTVLGVVIGSMTVIVIAAFVSGIDQRVVKEIESFAIGARKRDIIAQFLIEAGPLTGVGGLLGIVVGSGLALLIQMLMPTYITAVGADRWVRTFPWDWVWSLDYGPRGKQHDLIRLTPCVMSSATGVPHGLAALRSPRLAPDSGRASQGDRVRDAATSRERLARPDVVRAG